MNFEKVFYENLFFLVANVGHRKDMHDDGVRHQQDFQQPRWVFRRIVLDLFLKSMAGFKIRRVKQKNW